MLSRFATIVRCETIVPNWDLNYFTATIEKTLPSAIGSMILLVII